MELDANLSYALWWSGGLDSTLILAMLREQPKDFDIIQFRQFWTKEQARKTDNLIKTWDLRVHSYPPATTVSFIGQDDQISAVFEMAIGNGYAPIVEDVIEGTMCIENLATTLMPYDPMPHDVNIVGLRKDDNHYAVNVPSERWEYGGTTFWAPLYNWTREQVKSELRARGLDDSEASDEADTGNISICHNCIKGTGKVFCPQENQLIDSVIWDRRTNLTNFRNTYGS